MSGLTATSTTLVTGASGFVGACAARFFAAGGERVVAVHSSRSANRRWRLSEAAPPSIENVEVDLTSGSDVRALVRDVRPAVVINCAAYGAYAHQADAERTYRVNFEGVRHLLDAVSELSEFRAFVQAGSSSEYGLNCTAPREDSATQPDSDYAVSKVAATAFIQFVGAKRGTPAWALRLSSVYGPYEDASRLVPRLLTHARKGGFPPLANKSISRDFVYIDDVCAAFRSVVERAPLLKRGDVFNIGTGLRTTLEEIVTRVREHFRMKDEPVWGSMADRKWDHPDWYSNPEKALDRLGWKGTTSLADGLDKTARWMEAHPGLVSASEANTVTGVA